MAAGRACRAKGGLGWKVPTIFGQDFGAGHDEDHIASIAASVAHIRSLVVWPALPRFASREAPKGPCRSSLQGLGIFGEQVEIQNLFAVSMPCMGSESFAWVPPLTTLETEISPPCA